MLQLRVFWKIFALITLATLFASFLLARIAANEQERVVMQLTRQHLRSAGRFVAAQLTSDPNQDTDQINAAAKLLGLRLSLFSEGKCLADSEEQIAESVQPSTDVKRLTTRLQEGALIGDQQGEAYALANPDRVNTLFYSRIVNERIVVRVGIAEDSVLGSIEDSKLAISRKLLIGGLLSGVVASFAVGLVLAPLTTLVQLIRNDPRPTSLPIKVGRGNELNLVASSYKQLSSDTSRTIQTLRADNDRLAAVLEGMTEGVIAVDRDQRILKANDAAGRLLGFRPADVENEQLDDVVRQDEFRDALRAAIEDGRIHEAEFDSVNTLRTLALTSSALPGKPCPGAILVLQDITELRRLESVRQEFVAAVSHELKTPLSAIKAFAETLSAGAIEDPNHRLRFVLQIEEQTERLNRLILDMLSLARIESGKQAFEIETVTLSQAVTMCAQLQGPNAEANQINLVIETCEPLDVRADEEGVRQILDNLVDNAIKYTPAGGTVTIRWRREGMMARIEVQDTGVGIPEDVQHRVFERFFRVDKARSRELGGTGLGLSIVKHLAQFFDGSVDVRSAVGQGSTFILHLPLA